MLKMWKEEFNVKNFGLSHECPEDFTRCMWQTQERVLPWWLVYRVLMCFYFICSVVYTLVPKGKDTSKESLEKFLIFLTHWTYILEVMYFTVGFGITMERIILEDKNRSQEIEKMEKMPWSYRLFWILAAVVPPCSVMVTVVFWTQIYKPDLFEINASNLMEHVFNSVFVIIEYAIAAHGTRFFHFYFPIAYGGIYVLFSIIYYLCGGTGMKGSIPIYDILDWAKPLSTSLMCSVLMFVLIIVHFVFALAQLLKVWIKRKRLTYEV